MNSFSFIIPSTSTCGEKSAFLFNLYEQLMINSNFKKVYVFFLFHSLIFQGIQFNFTNCINCNQITNLYLIKAFLPLCTILILSHKCWEKPIYGLLPTFLNQT
ncbi:hypothetical protein [Spiroplasma endosymbiont of Apeira syringaria]|uniref:hypothetical protein n=1 Tax=Spiroplasma endosymbiont of Apeira syringaria TaxID=3066307 RepID=UPI0030D36308